MSKIVKAIHPEDDAHYRSLGLKKGVVQLWEDGLRTDPNAESYEWWYFDTHLDDGTAVVIVFYTKPMAKPKGPAAPFATIEITTPEGVKIEDTVRAPMSQCSFSSYQCDVRIGACTFKGDLNHYQIHFQSPRITADVDLTGTVPSWRCQCGPLLFGENEEDVFSWVPAVPEGRAKVDLAVDGRKSHHEGLAYHDHNWGNVSPLKLMHHWYWGRAKIGPYTVITSWITSEKRYGYKEFDVFMIAKDGKIISGNENHTLRFTASDRRIDPVTKKPYHAKLIFDYTDDDGSEYRIAYERERDIAYLKLVDQLPPVTRFGARLVGMDPSYIRFAGTASIRLSKNGQELEYYEAPAIWEAMYFGKVNLDLSH
ncbi:hypothetical protein [uncultured Adlercreutzia sp.]|uniref:hypothetical protein n=1 Tax=uncultured Adlercreutzia sp. TaxID=875803 RepID=UPI00258A7F31|nr:hypothetical protein [uncultured Adlercreutzia sp.]